MTMRFDIPRDLVAYMEALTTPDSEDWTIIPDGKIIHGEAFHEDTTPAGQRIISMGSFKISKSELKDTVKSLPKANCRPLGCITVILCADHAQNGTVDLLGWLTHMAKRKKFSVVVIADPALTSEAIESLTSDRWLSAQRDPSHQPLH